MDVSKILSAWEIENVYSLDMQYLTAASDTIASNFYW